MADAYSRVSGKIGVCCATVGPGFADLVPGVISAQFDNIPIGEISNLYDTLSQQYLMFLNKENLSNIEKQQMEEVGNQLNEAGRIYKQHLNKNRPYAEELIQKGEAYKVNPHLFTEYHNTGNINEGAYSDYKTMEGISWLGSVDKYPILVGKQQYRNEMIEFRKEDEPLQYVKTDEDDEIMRDENHMALYLSQEEMIERELPLTNTSVVAFNKNGQPIGWASNEFGADGVWVVEEYQKLGIGTDLLHEFRKQYKPGRQIGQMTGSGRNMTRSYHKKLVEEALKEGKEVPMDIRQEYELV